MGRPLDRLTGSDTVSAISLISSLSVSSFSTDLALGGLPRFLGTTGSSGKLLYSLLAAAFGGLPRRLGVVSAGFDFESFLPDAQIFVL